ncbi:MAG: hypothetical protein F4X98_17360 [Gammaproteobacteria bacterium]|nr:hypothetical protein [Gammaproteobacteria bacterium]
MNRTGRGRLLNIVNERADDVFRILYAERRKMRFHASEAAPVDEAENGDWFAAPVIARRPGSAEDSRRCLVQDDC